MAPPLLSFAAVLPLGDAGRIWSCTYSSILTGWARSRVSRGQGRSVADVRSVCSSVAAQLAGSGPAGTHVTWPSRTRRLPMPTRRSTGPTTPS